MAAMELPIMLVILHLGAGALPGGVSGLIIAKGKGRPSSPPGVTMTALRGITMVRHRRAPHPTGFQ